jgi:LPPG:FO 2-phospho-L-lactate transferase
LITVLAGGVGAARFLAGLVQVVDPATVTAIVNTGDDVEVHGLHVSPDIDTVVYTLGRVVDVDKGWGLADETWHAMATLSRYGGTDWFRLGDRDLGTHLYRTDRLLAGDDLASITADVAAAWGVGARVLPVTNDRLRTMVTLADDGREVDFQAYFVERRHSVPVRSVRFDGASECSPAPGVLAAIAGADVVVIAPSNPIVSIAPVLAVPGVRAAVEAAQAKVVAVSPIVAGAALKGPADRLLRELGHDASVVGVARLYADLASTLVIDSADAALAPAVEEAGVRAVVAPTVMTDEAAAARLASIVVESVLA